MGKLLGSSNLQVEQQREGSILRVYEEGIVLIDGEVVRSELATHLPCFKLRGDLLCHLPQGTLQGE